MPDRRGHGKQITVPLNSHDDNNDYGEQRQNVSRSLNCMVKGTVYFTYVQNYITIIQNGYVLCKYIVFGYQSAKMEFFKGQLGVNSIWTYSQA